MNEGRRIASAARMAIHIPVERHVETDPKRRRGKALSSEEEALLLVAIKTQRHRLAKASHMPVYIIFNDRTLIEMAQSRLEILDDMARTP